VAIAFDAVTSDVAASAGADVSFTHTPSGTPRGVLLLVTFQGGFDGTVDQLTSTPTYGGVNMTEVALSPHLFSGAEDKQIHIFHLGASIPTGAQTVAFTCDTIQAFTECITYTAAADTEVVDTTAFTTIASGDVTGTLSLGGRSCACAFAWASGEADPAATTPLTNWTARRETDSGSIIHGSVTYDIVGTSDVTFGMNQTNSQQLHALGVAIAEVEAAGAYELVPDAASYTYTATAAGLEFDRQIVPEAVSYAWTASDAGLSRGLPLVPEAASYVWTASDAGIEHGWLIVPEAAAYLWTATDAGLEYTPASSTYTLDADSAAYAWTASDVGFTYVSLARDELKYGIGPTREQVLRKYEEIEEIDRRIKAKESAERESVRRQEEAKRQLAELAEKKRQTKTIAERRRKLEARIDAYQSEIIDLRAAVVAMLDEIERARAEFEQQQSLQLQQTIADRRRRMFLLIAAAS
jgi:hypothetical protein